MKRVLTHFLITVAMMFCAELGHAQSWCTPSFTIGCGLDYVASFSTTGGSTNITNNGTGCSGGGYTFYNTMTHTTIQGTNVNYSFTINPTYTEAVKIWVDFNIDGDFLDIGEQVYSATVGPSSITTGTFTVPPGATPGLSRMRIRLCFNNATFTSCSQEPEGETEDYNFMIVAATPCSGTPNAGTAAATGSCPTVLGLTGITLAGQIAVQWQIKAACDTNWVNIPGATSYNYPVVSLAATTEFRAVVTCTNSSLTDTTNVVSLTAVAPCYPAPGSPTSTFYNDIISVTVGALSNTSTCGTTGVAGSILNRYSNFSNVPPVSFTKNTTIPFSIVTTDCNGFTPNYGTAIFIDMNYDGQFGTTERVYGNTAMVAGPQTVSGTFTIPMSSGTGLTGMRIIHGSDVAGNAMTASSSFTYGEVEDYMVNILYAPSATGDGVYCSGENVTLVASAPGLTGTYNYLWLKPNGTYDTAQTITLNNIQVSDGGIYKLRVLTYPCGGAGTPDTSGTRDVNVAVNQTPPAPLVAPMIVYCQYDDFDTIPVFGQNLKWYSIPTGGIGTTVEPVINTSVFGSVTYYVSQTINNCEGPRAPVTLNVVPKPNAPSVVSPVVYCQGDTPKPLQATGQNLRWYSVGQGGVGTPITPTPGTNAQGTYTWYVSQTVAGCESERTPVVVRVSYVPNALIQINRPYVCQYDTISLAYFGNATPDADYLWGLPTGATLQSGSGQGPLVVRFDTAGVHRIHLQVDNGGCKGPATFFDLTVRAVPVLALDMQADACVGDVVNMAVAFVTTSVDNYTWDFMGGETVYGAIPTGPYGLRWSTPGIKTITVVATDDDCSSLPTTDEIDVHALPDATISAIDGVNICAGDSVMLQATYDPDNSYRWEPEQYFGPNNTSTEIARVDRMGYVYLSVTNEYNCIGRDSLLINAEPCCNVTFPNVFTPNGDGKNDFFRMIRKGGSKEISSFRVVNRWGHTVFETADDHIGWDGTYNGKPQDMGIYNYYVRYKCADGNFYEHKGDVMLMR